MKTCVMCGVEKEDTALFQGAAATWNGHNNWAEVCAECQNTTRFKAWAKPKLAKAAAAAKEQQNAAEAPAPVERAPRQPSIQIAHRRTGALIHEVPGNTLVGASLPGATLSGADLQHAALRNADLQKADLRLANLAGADLRGADLRGANFRGADLRGADFRDAKLQRADLNHVLYDSSTRWPAGFDPRTTGASQS